MRNLGTIVPPLGTIPHCAVSYSTEMRLKLPPVHEGPVFWAEKGAQTHAFGQKG